MKNPIDSIIEDRLKQILNYPNPCNDLLTLHNTIIQTQLALPDNEVDYIDNQLWRSWGLVIVRLLKEHNC